MSLTTSRVFFLPDVNRLPDHPLLTFQMWKAHTLDLQSISHQTDRESITNSPTLMAFSAFANLPVTPESIAGYLFHLKYPICLQMRRTLLATLSDS